MLCSLSKQQLNDITVRLFVCLFVWRQSYCVVVLVRVSIAMMKHHDQKQIGEEMVYLAYTSTPQFITKGSQSRNSHREGTWSQELLQKPWRVLLTDLLPMACSACFLMEPRITSPGMAPTTMSWALPHQSPVKKLPYSLLLWGHSHSWGSSSQMNLACIKMT